MKKFLLIVKNEKSKNKDIVSILDCCKANAILKFKQYNKNCIIISTLEVPLKP